MADAESAGTFSDVLSAHVKLSTPETRAAVAGGAGYFLIAPERAEKFIADVSAAAALLTHARDRVIQARWRCPEEADQVSRNFAVQAESMSDNAVAAAERHQAALLGVVDNLRRDLAAYRQAEEANAVRRA